MRVLLPFVAAFLASGVSHAEIYKWIDVRGQTHYSDSPPGLAAPDLGPAPPDSPARGRIRHNLSLRSVGTDGASPEELQDLFGQIKAACGSGLPEAYFDLLATPARGLMLVMPSSEQQAAFARYCGYAGNADAAIGGSPEGGIHAVEQDRSRKQNGINVSYWYIRTKQGRLVFRTTVVYENGRLKINGR